MAVHSLPPMLQSQPVVVFVVTSFSERDASSSLSLSGSRAAIREA
jgi:hypothetical protein